MSSVHTNSSVRNTFREISRSVGVRVKVTVCDPFVANCLCNMYSPVLVTKQSKYLKYFAPKKTGEQFAIKELVLVLKVKYVSTFSFKAGRRPAQLSPGRIFTLQRLPVSSRQSSVSAT